MKNVTELRIELAEVFKEIKARTLTVQEAKNLIAATNVMMKSATAELEYNKFTEQKKKIMFYES